ncbi:MAG: sodium:solute symporter family protein [Victivallaceae bacterium]|nr:sodium:solute symporter family protein [Victivallaceae bacterium]
METFFLLADAGSMKLDAHAQWMLWIGIAVYMAVLLLIGFWSSRRINDMKDFLVAGRRLPLWMATATLLATWFGAGSSMGVAATVYESGLRGVIADPFGASLSLLLAGIFIVGLLRKCNCMTVTDIISHRFGKSAGIYASLWMLPVYIGWIAAQVLGMGTILNVLTGISVFKGTLLGAVIVLFYTVGGGMWAVTLTDVLQVGLLVIGLLIIMPFAIHQSGGVAAVAERLQAGDLSLGWGTPGSFNDYTYYIGTWIIMGLGCMVGQDLIQRSLASRDEKVAISSSVFSGFLYLMIGVIPITIGFTARFILGSGIDSNQVMPRMAITILGNLHPLLMTLFLAALISAIMSSADSSLLAGASLLVRNIIEPLFPSKSGERMLLRTRVITIVLLIFSTTLAFLSDSIYSLMINCWTSQLVVVFLPVILALYAPRTSKSCVWTVMVVSTAVWLFYTFVNVCGTNMPFSELLNSELFEYAQTCGAVYGFLSGIVCYVFIALGEKLTARVSGEYVEKD